MRRNAAEKPNSLRNVHGFGAYQLVLGRNPNFPANYVNQCPALQRTAASKTIDEHVSALHAAREAFMRKDHESLKETSPSLHWCQVCDG